MIRLTKRPERGAAVVEMAFVLPLFLLMIFGTIEAGWLLAQTNSINHGAREGARLAAVNYSPNAGVNDVLDGMCNRMGIASSSNPVVTLSTTNTNGDAFSGRGDLGNVKVTITYSSLTGILDGIFDGKTITSETEFRLEQPLDGSTPIDWQTVNVGEACP
jgi:Flp pilus assembly protein TadG